MRVTNNCLVIVLYILEDTEALLYSTLLVDGMLVLAFALLFEGVRVVRVILECLQ